MNVHVMAPPDGERDDDSRFCDQPDGGEITVYHVAAERIGETDDWHCPLCGETTLPTVLQ